MVREAIPRIMIHVYSNALDLFLHRLSLRNKAAQYNPTALK